MSLYAFNKTTSTLKLAGLAVSLPASGTTGVRGLRWDVTNELRGLSGAQYTALQAQVTAGSVDYEWSTPVVEYATTNLIIGTDAAGVSAAFAETITFPAGAGGAPDDVAIYSANAPYGFRILDIQLFVSTVVVLSTSQLRNATGGGGSALSDAMVTTALARVRDLGATVLVPPTIAQGGTLVLRRSDSGVAGTLVLLIQKT